MLSGEAGDDSIQGDAGDDSIAGDDGNDTLYGDDPTNVLTGADSLRGGNGNDTIFGGQGADVIQGELGVDRLYGGGGADRFAYTSLATSPPSGQDIIVDFSQAQFDRFEVGFIDADPTVAGDQAFRWIDGANFSGAGTPELCWYQSAGATYILADTGDGAADLRIKLNGLFTLLETDFVL